MCLACTVCGHSWNLTNVVAILEMVPGVPGPKNALPSILLSGLDKELFFCKITSFFSYLVGIIKYIVKS